MTLSNKITFVRILLIPIFLIFALPPAPWFPDFFINFINSTGSFLAIALFIIAALTDILDGRIARKRNEVTNLGIFLDPIADKLLVISALLVLIVKYNLSPWIVIIIIARELLVMGIRMMAAGEGVVIAASIWGKIKTVVQIIAVIAFMANDIVAMGPWDDILMYSALIITIISGTDYFVKNMHFIVENKK